MVWLGARRGHLVDWVTQRWVEHSGRRIDSSQSPWLSGPVGSTGGIGAAFFEQWGASHGLTALPARDDDGLIEDLGSLRAPDFDPRELDPRISEFYARTAAFDLEVRSTWEGPFRGIGWLVAAVFARRLGQLDIPVAGRHPQPSLHSRIVRLADAGGRVRHVGWVRSMAGSERSMFVGEYGIARIPGHEGPCVKVVFPLPNGNAIILLRPRVTPDGGLSLTSDGARFGDPGFYFTVAAGQGSVFARYVRTMKEELRMSGEGDGITARHRFVIFGRRFLELDYRIRRSARDCVPC